ncbi:GPW/gp25 family protein [Brucella pseudogrignonensis]|uniref:Phage baseplate assembly protein W n=1 Tax=Brucella pseudogrignonensis TaxID=419475 RepID=A0ABU1M5K2_9HYPH|nr:GPW/gp25 family protein [Brucella pseudogrignonensis]MDR6431304.1 phage baseplate assembly protein W [Brucella pseudogrignonensis]
MERNAALGIDLDRVTGEVIVGWAHVEQCIGDFLTTFFGERVMREWYGSIVPKLMGENLTTETIVTFFAAVTSAIDQWEPRYKIAKITPLSVDRSGEFQVRIEGDYRPLALIGNFTSGSPKHLIISGAVGRGLVLI